MFILSLAISSVWVPLHQILAILTGTDSVKALTMSVIHDVRLPRSLTAILAGAALGIAGLQMQTLFRNPLADPYALGIASGASLGVALGVADQRRDHFRRLWFEPGTRRRRHGHRRFNCGRGAGDRCRPGPLESSRESGNRFDSGLDVRLCRSGIRDGSGRRNRSRQAATLGRRGDSVPSPV